MGENGTHPCPGPDCPRLKVPDDLLACRAHWYQVPRRIRMAVYLALEEHGQGSTAHLAACNAAVRYMRPLGRGEG